jgi:serine/threonine protein kinase
MPADDRWRRIEALYHEALELPADQRAAFLDGACGGDDALRREAEALVAGHENGGDFLSRGAAEIVASGHTARTADLLGQTIGRYQVLSLLGVGGMGEVYSARDTQTNLIVAIKVLNEAAAFEPDWKKRFEREARLASQINHPNVCALYEMGTDKGIDYIVMELVEGRTLADRIVPQPMTVAEALPVFAQIADALEAAHEKKIVHRDLTPSNVKITPSGKVKVLDFGLAKSLRQALLDETTVWNTRSRQGILVGTPAYMSPERARGETNVDGRADVWAFGCCLFEALTGKAAFSAQTVLDTLAGVLLREPAWDALPTGTPLALRALLLRCLHKDAAERPDAAQLRKEFSRCAARGPGSRDLMHLMSAWRSRHKKVLRRAFIGFSATLAPLAILFSVWTVTPERSPDPPDSIAVLPFEDLSEDASQKQLSENLTRGLTARLAGVGGLKHVGSWNAVVPYKGTTLSPAEIGKRLKVQSLITGAVMRSRNRVTVNVQWIQVATSEVLWAMRYERDLRDVASLRGEILGDLVDGMKLPLTPEEKVLLERPGPLDPDVYDAYLKGMSHWSGTNTAGNEKAYHYFELALEKDPEYAADPDWDGLRKDAGFQRILDRIHTRGTR